MIKSFTDNNGKLTLIVNAFMGISTGVMLMNYAMESSYSNLYLLLLGLTLTVIFGTLSYIEIKREILNKGKQNEN